MDTQKICTKCGKELSSNSKFCKNCGIEIVDNNDDKKLKTIPKSLGKINKEGLIVSIIIIIVFSGLIYEGTKDVSTSSTNSSPSSQSEETKKIPTFLPVQGGVGRCTGNNADEYCKSTYGHSRCMVDKGLSTRLWEGQCICLAGYEWNEDSTKCVNQNLPSTGILEQPDQLENNNKNLEDIINLWKQRVFRVTCFFNYANTSEIYQIQQGSGFMSATKDGYILVTNKHIVMNGEYTSYYCDVESADKLIKFKIESPNIHVSKFFDTAGMQIFTDEIISNNFSYPLCDNNKINIGENIIVLGYPKIGATSGITATEGIISGIEDYYFVTSAKIDEGNSGGAAISTENNCYIGIPTLSKLGEIESLGRILDFKKTMDNEPKSGNHLIPIN